MVRSAYYHSNSGSIRNRGESSTWNNQEGFWQSIWDLNFMNGVKSFIWRACQESLLTCLNLQKRKLMANSLCPICHLHEESITHILWDCESGKDVWSECHKIIQKIYLPPMSFRDIWAHLSTSLKQDELQLVTYIARLLWNRRNDLVFNKNFMHPNMLLAKAQDELTAFLSTQSLFNPISSI